MRSQIVNCLYAENKRRVKVDELCMLFGFSKQAYYKLGRSIHSKAYSKELALQFIIETKAKDPGIGGKKLWFMYMKEFKDNNPLGRDTFLRIISDNGFKLRKKTSKTQTTDSQHSFPLYPNIAKEIIPIKVNQLWVSDITYIPISTCDGKKFSYLSLITDAYSKEIVGWQVGDTLESKFTIQALKSALNRIDSKSANQLIHHSDRGCQYACWEYVNILQKTGVQISMTEDGNPKDNATAERINNTIKNELLKGKVFRNITEVEKAVASAVHFYNNERPHMSINYLTPVEASLHTGEMPKKWVSYREKAIKGRSEKLDIPENSLPLSSVNG